jgi:hypothetical protein
MSLRMLAVALPILLACSKSTTNSSSQATPMTGGENNEAARKELAQIEDDWLKANEAHDTAFYALVVAPDFHGITDSAKTFGRDEMVGSAADTTLHFRNMTDEDRQIRI